MKTGVFFGGCLFFSTLWGHGIDIESWRQDFVLETKKIDIPGYPEAFNPSIVRWEEGFLLSFRVIPNPKEPFISRIGLVRLNADFSPTGEVDLLDTRIDEKIPFHAEDGRLIQVGEKLYLLYVDCCDERPTNRGVRMHLAEVIFDGSHFSLTNLECLSSFPGASQKKREKNWVPFEYEDQLFLSYSIDPHRVFHADIGKSCCSFVGESKGKISWDWGILRGGTPGVKIGNEYLAFFHSSIPMASLHSNGEVISHYFMGAYTYAGEPPFTLTRISPMPIVGENFYQGPSYSPYWNLNRVVFPGGYVFDKHKIWVVFGRQDHETWVVCLDRERLFLSLMPVLPVDKGAVDRH